MEPGGARAPVEILEEIDIDVNSPALWQGFDVIRALIRQLEVVCA
jgi:oligoendopeptidase F